MTNILATRFSALGDVAMTISVLKSFADAYPNDHITLLSRPFVAPLLEGLPANVHFRPVNLNDYKGVNGLRRLSRQLIDEGYDALADMHDVLRTKVVRFFFRKANLPVATIDKGRKDRKQITRIKNKQLRQLTPSPQRYADVLAQLGFPITLNAHHIYGDQPADISDLADITGIKGTDTWIGIAPFAAHEGKIYPLPLMEEVICRLAGIPGLKIFLFGSGAKEKQWCDSVSQPNVVSMVGKTNLSKELRLMTNLSVMVTMDSANMHLSALAGTPTVSIWGATHPMAGFAGMQASGSRIVQLDMDCRPCSIFGNKKCIKGNYPCMNNITPCQVTETIKQFI